jgi:glycosyltransferase involved in cell wall biosynthesis
MKKVLIISHPFPPTGGGGVQRVSKFVKYLPRFGWQPVVLSARTGYYPLRDESLLGDIPRDVRVARTFSLEPGRGALAVSAKVRTPGRRQGLRGWLIERSIAWLFVPDKSIGWVPFAARAAGRLLAEEDPDVVFVTGNPFSSFLIPYFLHRSRRIPYVLDFRDAWTLEPYRRRYPAWRERLEKRLEERILQGASAAVMATSPMADTYAERYPALACKLRTITNGYDEDDFLGLTPRRSDRFTFLHSGSLYSAFRRPDGFLRAYRRALDADPAMRRGSRVVFVGSAPSELEGLVADLALGGNVLALGYLPHRESLEHLVGADALVLICGSDRMEQSGKVFEYMRARKPVIAVAREDGAAARVVGECGGGVVVPGRETGRLQEAIARAFAGEIVPGTDESGLGKYSREELTRSLAEVLDEAV